MSRLTQWFHEWRLAARVMNRMAAATLDGGKGDDHQFGAAKLATGSIRAFVDVPRGVVVQFVELPPPNESQGRILVTVAPGLPAADLARRFQGCADAIRGRG